MIKMKTYLILLLFIGLAWGKSLKLVNTNGQSVIIKPSQGTFISLPTTGLIYLNGTKYVLFDVDYKGKTVRVKKYYRTNIGRIINYFNYEEIPFDSIYSIKHKEQSFNIIPLLIGGGIGYYNMAKPNADFLSVYLGTIPAITLGTVLSFIPRFSEELIVSDDDWVIKNN